MDHFNTERITVDGREFEVRFYYDDDADRPWERCDGHGPVRKIRARDEKYPGERIMTSGERNAYIWAYDVAKATRIARREGWGLSEQDAADLARRLKRQPTRGDIAAEAVRRDFDFLRGWVCDQWHYMGVTVLPIGADGEPDEADEYRYALWGIESTGDYWREVAEECARECLSDRRAAWRAALKEARARKYWAQRDIITTGAYC